MQFCRHSKKLYAWETGPVDDLAMLLLCGDSDFKVGLSHFKFDRRSSLISTHRCKLVADIATIDRNKVRFNVSPKTNVALKYLRMYMDNILAQQFRGRPLDQVQSRWKDIGMTVLAKTKPKDDAALIDLRVT
jgi:ATP-dependent RNA helicase DHX29